MKVYPPSPSGDFYAWYHSLSPMGRTWNSTNFEWLLGGLLAWLEVLVPYRLTRFLELCPPPPLVSATKLEFGAELTLVELTLVCSKLLSPWVRDTATWGLSSEVTGVIIPSVISIVVRPSITHEFVSKNTHIWANQMVTGSFNSNSLNYVGILYTIALLYVVYNHEFKNLYLFL